LNPVFTIGEQLTNVIQHNQQVSHKRACQIADDVILRVKLPEADRILKKYPHELSGGQRQRAIIAIALSCQAEFLIADEPTRNLDVTIQAGILKLMADLRQELNITMLFIANNLGLVSVICNRVGILFNGEIVETGTTGEVLRDPRHPYTLALLEAVTRQRKEANGLHRVDLSVAAGLEPGGCSYAGRCIHKTGLCLKEAPALAEIGGTHLVACHRRMEGGDRQ
jgi:oligopeptide/dipeptide ABC transporter ATP-binding protein